MLNLIIFTKSSFHVESLNHPIPSPIPQIFMELSTIDPIIILITHVLFSVLSFIVFYTNFLNLILSDASEIKRQYAHNFKNIFFRNYLRYYHKILQKIVFYTLIPYIEK